MNESGDIAVNTWGQWFTAWFLWGGDTARAAWAAIADFFVLVFGWLGNALNPVLSPLLRLLNPVMTMAGDAVYGVLSPLPVWLGLTLISAVAGVVMLLVFGKVSNQKAIAQVKDDIKANLLALKLFKDELHVTFGAMAKLFWAVARLQGHMLLPVLIMALPMLLVIAQMGVRYQWRPLKPGEPALIRAHFRGENDEAVPVPVTLESSSGVNVEAGPLAGADDLCWRIRGGESGRHQLSFVPEGGTPLEKELVVGDVFQRVSAERPGAEWVGQLLHPVEPVLPSDSPIRSIEILYPGVDSYIYGSGWWLLYFFIVSMLFAFLFKPIFKVNF